MPGPNVSIIQKFHCYLPLSFPPPAFSVLYVVHGLLQERMFALVAYSVTVVVITVSIIVNYSTKQQWSYYGEHPLSKPFNNPLRMVHITCIDNAYGNIHDYQASVNRIIYNVYSLFTFIRAPVYLWHTLLMGHIYTDKVVMHIFKTGRLWRFQQR